MIQVTNNHPGANANSNIDLVVNGVHVASTRDVTSLISGGAMTVAGGMTVAKRMYVGDDLIVAGQIIGTGNTVRPTMVLSNATNVSSSQLATINGYTSDQDLVSVENIVCVGVPNTRRMILKFQARDTSAHHFSICAHYYNESPPGTITIPPTLMLQQWYTAFGYRDMDICT
ncbi:hypothetical protein BCR44DRAFT_1508522 [Catenaria anguillulae PL171]|uniref:Uncharacterized protein n=1 Tax=Catenaria anguillulae PL171 TaxID=765915 RepID=A0A1Y2GFR2_9FUNG|nr:hypothetical protein BCR44DRAFT_1508522 [Catenaria anguillulae PL171]